MVILRRSCRKVRVRDASAPAADTVVGVHDPTSLDHTGTVRKLLALLGPSTVHMSEAGSVFWNLTLLHWIRWRSFHGPPVGDSPTGSDNNARMIQTER